MRRRPGPVMRPGLDVCASHDGVAGIRRGRGLRLWLNRLRRCRIPLPPPVLLLCYGVLIACRHCRSGSIKTGSPSDCYSRLGFLFENESGLDSACGNHGRGCRLPVACSHPRSSSVPGLTQSHSLVHGLSSGPDGHSCATGMQVGQRFCSPRTCCRHRYADLLPPACPVSP